MKVLTVVDPQTPLSKMHFVGASMLPYDLCQKLSHYNDIDMSILVYNDLNVDDLDGVKIVDLGPPKSRYQQQVAKRLKEIIDDYDLIHLHISTPGFVKYLTEFSKNDQKKIIFTMHTWTNSLAISYFYREYFEKLVTDSEVNIVFLTHKQSDALLKSVEQEEFYNPQRIFYVNNAVNLPITYTDKKRNRVIAVGRMVESKGIDKIVRACIESGQRLLLVSPPWRMTPKEEEYRNKVLDLVNSAPTGQITLIEGMPHDELIEEIKTSKAGILFSTFDVFSLFILECVYSGTPVLAYDSGSTSEVCDILKNCGVVRFSKYKELVKILTSNDLPSGNLTSNIPENCRYHKFVENYHDLYNFVQSTN